jgi:plastocyanin
MRAGPLAAALVALTFPAGAAAQTHGHGAAPAASTEVSMLASAFAPTHVDVLAGDSVHWSNDSVRRHTVTADDESWTSAELFVGETYDRAFDPAGVVTYYCRVHPFMRGEVAAHALLLTAPREPGAPGRAYSLAGRAALPAGTAVTVEGDDGGGGGFRPAGRGTVGEDGAFRVSVTPAATASYRAVAGDAASPSVRLLVVDRKVQATSVRRRGHTTVKVHVTPAAHGMTVVLQLRLPERFGWWPVRQTRLNHHSMATWHLRTQRRLRARAVLTLADGATPLARSDVFRVGRRAR